jgi:DNA-binding winged helix-turn-helix (wHTH) protein/tetratricopeptide (TPR) repeat protein/TolB-like protein
MGTPTQSWRYRFGLFEADTASGELLRQGVPVRVQDQPFRLLTILLGRPGEVVSREEIRERLWPADTYVEFDGSLKAALKRLREALGDSAENPIFIETLPKRGYRFIAPIAVEEKQLPTETQEQVVETLALPQSSLPEEVTLPPRPPSQRRRQLTYAVCLIAVLLAVVGWLGFRVRFHPNAVPSSNAVPLPMRRSVAILGFRNASGRATDDWLATAFSEMLSTELTTGEKLRLVTGEEVANLRLSSPWSQTSTLSNETTARLGAALNSDVLVLGSYTVVGSADRGQLRLDVRLQNSRTGEVLAQIAQAGSSDDLFRVTAEVGARLRDQLGIPRVSDAEQAEVLASTPLSRDGARFYALGIARLREFDALTAKDLLQQAVAADPKFSLAHLTLAGAWGQLGYEQKQKDEVKKAKDLSTDLPRMERMQVEGDYYRSLPDPEKAASTYRAMFELFPDNVEYGLQLAYSENTARHPSLALETIARLRRLAAPASDDPRIDIAEARILHVSDHRRWADARTLLHTAETKASAQGKKLVYALARLGECMNLVYGENPVQADAPCEDAYNIYRATGNNLLAADALRMIADKQGGEGHTEQARATYERALKILAGQGENLKTAIILNNMAIGYANQGNLDRGEQLYRKAKLHFEQAGDEHNASIALLNIADILYLRGNLPAALRTYEQVIEINASMEKGDPSYAKYRMADLELATGQVQEAHDLVTQALDSFRSLRNSDLAFATNELGEILEAGGDLRGARQQYEAALALRQTLGRASEIAESEVSLAELELEESHPDHAEALLQQAIAQFEKEKEDPDTASAYTLISRALLREGKVDEAWKALQRARELVHGSPDPALKLEVSIQSFRIDVEANQEATAARLALPIQRLRAAITSAKKLGYYRLECEARLALAEAEMKIHPFEALSQLKSIEQETHQRGLALLSRKAHLLIAASQPGS